MKHGGFGSGTKVNMLLAGLGDGIIWMF